MVTLKKRFEQFRLSSGLNKESGEQQASTLLYCLCDDAEDVLLSSEISDEDRKDYAKVVSTFDGYFQVRKNVIFERARFNRRSQRDGENAEEYIAALYSLAENCQYGALKEEMIRDRLVVGIRDIALSERLQLDAKLTLEKAKKEVRQKEAVREQNQTLKETGDSRNNPIVLDSMGRDRGADNARRNPRNGRPGKFGDRQKRCTRCGRGPHNLERCPARLAACHKCQKLGHFSVVCRSKSSSGSVDTVKEEPDTDSDENAFLDAIDGKGRACWTVNVLINSQEKQFKLDTGAEVTAISEDCYHTLKDAKLRRPSRVLYGPGRKPLEVVGEIDANLSYKQSSSRQQIFVVKGLDRNLLGLPAITALKLAARLDNTNFGRDYESLVKESYPMLFQGLGNLGEPYEIQLQPDAKPHALLKKVQAELSRMESMGVISKVDKPTEWCAGMVAVPKRKSEEIRICVDLKPLNKSVLREVHPMPKVDETLAQLAGARLFSKLDANSGFWQIPLSETSRHLTTFLTPFGRYCFNKLPFGISSAPEHFQKRMSKILQGLEGVVCQVDDVLIFGKDALEHDERLMKALERIAESGVTLNEAKCKFGQDRIEFLGHVIDQNGISASPEKVAALVEMKPPTNVTGLRRFLGMANQLGKFSQQLAELSKPLRDLLSTNNDWIWGPEQDKAFLAVKEELAKPTTLALYDPAASTKVAADASSFGLGAVLLQQNQQHMWKPIAFASRSLTQTEHYYATIEKEALAITWACEKFASYIVGMKFHIETDHKPLIPQLSCKHLDSLPPRILRFRLRLNRFNYSIQYVPGKQMYTADALSRSPVALPGSQSIKFQEELEFYVEAVTTYLPASKDTLDCYRRAQEADAICSTIKEFSESRWPARYAVSTEIRPYWTERGKFSVASGLLLYGSRIVVPEAIRKEALEKLHQGHQGIQRCKIRAASSVWWPGINKDVTEVVRGCPKCVEHSSPQREPMIPSLLPKYPWQKIASDLFILDGNTYLLVVDYFSRYPEVTKLSSTTSQCIITALQSIFSRHGIPEIMMSDNGHQFSSQEMKKFAEHYDFIHVTSSPLFPQSNGLVERMVKTVKQLLKKSPDPFLALLSYRSTPFPWCGLSPAELLMGRRIRSSLPQVPQKFVPTWTFLKEFQTRDRKFKKQQTRNYNRRHRVRPLPQIADDSPVWSKTADSQTEGKVITATNAPRSYIVETPTGDVRRNRLHLKPIPEQKQGEEEGDTTTDDPCQRSPIKTRSRSGITLMPPERLYH